MPITADPARAAAVSPADNSRSRKTDVTSAKASKTEHTQTTRAPSLNVTCEKSMTICGLTSELTGTYRQGAARRMLPRTSRGALPVRVRVERPVRQHRRPSCCFRRTARSRAGGRAATGAVRRVRGARTVSCSDVRAYRLHTCGEPFPGGVERADCCSFGTFRPPPRDPRNMPCEPRS